jgi:hypothetical protein
MPIQSELDRVTLKLKANIYFDGGVVSYTITGPDGTRQTVGLIRQGRYHFNTDTPERMDIIAGSCRVQGPGETEWKTYQAGQAFTVPGKSSFDIAVDSGLTEYLCSYK